MTRSPKQPPSDSEIFELVRAEAPDPHARARTLASVLEENRRLCARGESAESTESADARDSEPAPIVRRMRWRAPLLLAAACAAAALVVVWARRATNHGVVAGPETITGWHPPLMPGAPSACVPRACTPVVPGDALITDFRDLGPGGVFVDNDAYSRREPDWWQRFYGTPWIVPASPQGLRESTDGVWRIAGTVRQWSGFGLWFGACTVDLSAYRGVSFRIWGDAGPTGELLLSMDTDADVPRDPCRPNVGSCDTAHYRCIAPSKRFRVPRVRGAPIKVSWSDFSGGEPRAAPDPARILQLRWAFDMSSSAYPIDVRVDDVRLVE